MKHTLLTIAVVCISFSAYSFNHSPETPCFSTLDSTLVQVCTGDTFYFDTNAYTHTGVYFDTLLNQGGCDSVIALFVSFSIPPTDTLIRAICQGDTVHLGDSVYTQAGVYYDTVRNESCIISYDALFLTFNVPGAVTLSWDSLIANSFVTNYLYPLGSQDTSIAYWTPCNKPAIPLSGGYPPGGIYSGTGVSNDTFYAASVYYNPPYPRVDTITYSLCNVTVMDTIVYASCEGITSIRGAALFNLYPNPADDYTTISFNAAYTGATVFVKDITGRQLYQTQLATGPQQIPTGNLPPGIYLVTISTGEQVGARLLVKE